MDIYNVIVTHFDDKDVEKAQEIVSYRTMSQAINYADDLRKSLTKYFVKSKSFDIDPKPEDKKVYHARIEFECKTSTDIRVTSSYLL